MLGTALGSASAWAWATVSVRELAEGVGDWGGEGDDAGEGVGEEFR